jgi:hypothetical protein
MGADPSKAHTSRLVALAACLTISVGVLVPAAAAKPTVIFAARAVPIPKNLLEPGSRTWPHTGDFPGAGAELEASFTIQGTEDAGLPGPLRRVAFSLSRGTTIDTHGFATCRPRLSGWSRTGPPCPSSSFASVPGQETDMVNFAGQDIVSSPRAHGAFFPAGGGIGFWTHTTGGPFVSGGFNTGSLTPTAGAYGAKLTENLPLQTAVGPWDLSTTSFDLTLGAAYRKGGRLHSIVTMPKTCPASGLAVKAELSFGAGAQSTWETVTLTSKEPCRK